MLCAIEVHAQKLKINTVPEGLQKAYLDGKDTVPIVNLREIYIEAYSLPETSEYIYLHTTAELKQIFGENFPDDTESDFYEMEIGTAGLMRNYMARKCDIHFPLERKLSRFLTAAMRVYRVPEAEQAKVLAFIQSLDIKAIATEVMYKLFAMLEMKYDFKLSKNGEMEETR